MKKGVEGKREVPEGSCPDWIPNPPVRLSQFHPPALPPGPSYKSKNYLVPGTSQTEAVPGKGGTRSCMKGPVWGLLASVDQRIHYLGSDHTQRDTTLPSLFSPLKLKEDRIVSAIDRGRKQAQTRVIDQKLTSI